MAHQVGAANPHASLQIRYRAVGQLGLLPKHVIAAEASVSERTIRRWEIKYENTLEVERSRDPGSKRPRVSTQDQDNILLNYARDHPWDCVPDIIAATNNPGSASTAGRRLRAAGLHSHIAAQTEELTNEQKAARVMWCQQHMNIPLHRWLDLVTSDEKVVCSTTDTQRLVRRPIGTRHDPEYVATVKLSGRFSCAFWCCVSGQGTGGMHYIPRTMNSVLYCDLLQHRFLPAVRQRFPNGRIDFIHDNNSSHTSRYTRNWITNHQDILNVWQWPPNSPDLNYIENVFGLLERRRVLLQLPRPDTPEILMAQMLELWDRIEPDYIRNMALSMPERIIDCIAIQGNRLPY